MFLGKTRIRPFKKTHRNVFLKSRFLAVSCSVAKHNGKSHHSLLAVIFVVFLTQPFRVFFETQSKPRLFQTLYFSFFFPIGCGCVGILVHKINLHMVSITCTNGSSNKIFLRVILITENKNEGCRAAKIIILHYLRYV